MTSHISHSSDALDRVFFAVCDPTRRALLTRLTKGPATVSELTAPFQVSRPAISKHLKVLEQAGLMERRVEGRIHRCTAAADPLHAAERWLAERRAYWDQQLESLREFVDSTEQRDPISTE